MVQAEDQAVVLGVLWGLVLGVLAELARLVKAVKEVIQSPLVLIDIPLVEVEEKAQSAVIQLTRRQVRELAELVKHLVLLVHPSRMLAVVVVLVC
jgi:hypothetical protein